MNLIILALCAAAWLQGCDNNNGTRTTGAEKIRLAFVGSTPDDYWSIVRLGCDYAARQLGDVDLDFRFIASRTAVAPQELVGDLVSNGVDGIAISPLDAGSQTDFLNGIAAKALLECADSDTASSKRVCCIGTDNVATGKQAAALLKAALPQGGKVILLVGYANAQNTKDRVQGLQSGLAGSNIQILDTLADGAKSAGARKNAEDALAQHPDLVGMAGLYGYHGPVILAVVHDVLKVGQVKIVCFDNESDTMAGIAVGDIYGTVVQKPLQIAWETVVHMHKYLRCDQTALADGQSLIASQTVTKENLVEFQDWQKSLRRNLQTEHP